MNAYKLIQRMMPLGLVAVASIMVACSDVKFENVQAASNPPQDGSGSGPGGFDPNDPRYTTESFTQKPPNSKLDILFIVDNSVSMETEQQRLGARLANFTSKLSNLDWQIGITTTDIDSFNYGLDGKLLTFPNGSKVINKTTPNVNNEFLSTVVRPETLNCSSCPSGSEEPLKAMVRNFQQHSSATAPLYRANADLAVVVLSDEDENSSGSGTTPSDVISSFDSQFGTDKSLSVYGVIVEPGDTVCYNEQNQQSDAYYGQRVWDLSAITDGTTSSICAPDYGAGLEKIAEHAFQVAMSVQLKSAPAPASVRITLIPKQNVQFAISGRKVLFKTPPAPGTQIQIKYIPQSKI